jgi:hypothetical protein
MSESRSSISIWSDKFIISAANPTVTDVIAASSSAFSGVVAPVAKTYLTGKAAEGLRERRMSSGAESSGSINDETGAGGSQPEKAIHNMKSVKDGYVYKARIRAEWTGFVVDRHPASLQAGMTVQADIATDQRRVFDFLLSPLVKYLDEGAKIR